MVTTELPPGAKATISPMRGTEKISLPVSASYTLTEPSWLPATNLLKLSVKPPKDVTSGIPKLTRLVLRSQTFSVSDLSQRNVASDKPSGEKFREPTTWS